MSYYFIAATTRHDVEKFTDYLQKVTPVLLANNCKPLSVNAEFKVMGGDASIPGGEAQPDIVILLEFPSKADFDSWWDSDEYVELAKLRHESSTAWIGLGVEGQVNIPGL